MLLTAMAELADEVREVRKTWLGGETLESAEVDSQVEDSTSSQG
jgi:hypothetical protein